MISNNKGQMPTRLMPSELENKETKINKKTLK